MSHIAMTLCLCILVEACSRERVADGHTDAGDSQSDIDRGMDMLERAATIVESNKGNCDAMGRELDAYYKANANAIRRIKTGYDSMPVTERREAQARNHERFNHAWTKIRANLGSCKTHPLVAQVTGNVATGDAGAAWTD